MCLWAQAQSVAACLEWPRSAVAAQHVFAFYGGRPAPAGWLMSAANRRSALLLLAGCMSRWQLHALRVQEPLHTARYRYRLQALQQNQAHSTQVPNT